MRSVVPTVSKEFFSALHMSFLGLVFSYVHTHTANCQQVLTGEMESKRNKFMAKWIGEKWEGSQENSFYDALVTLVRNGLTDESPALQGPYLNSFQVRRGARRNSVFSICPAILLH